MILNYLELQDGDDFITSNGIRFKQPTINDVKFYGEDVYIWWMFTWVYDKYDLIHQLWKVGIDFDDITKDELFITTVKNNKDAFLNMLAYFTNINRANVVYLDEYESDCIIFSLKDEEEVRILTPQVFDEISHFIKTIHYFKNKPMRKFLNNSDKKHILEYEIQEMENDAKKSKATMGYISKLKQALVVYNSRTWEYVSNLTVYQLFSEVDGIGKLEESKRLYQALYAGTVDSNKIKKKDLDWIN